MLLELKLAVRALLRSLGFASAAVLTLALGIGATVAIFSLVDAVLLRALPYKEPARIARIYAEAPLQHLERHHASTTEFFELRRDLRSWTAIDAWRAGGANLSAAGTPLQSRCCSARSRRSLVSSPR